MTNYKLIEEVLKEEFVLDKHTPLKIWRENKQWAIGHVNLDHVYLGDTIDEAFDSLCQYFEN